MLKHVSISTTQTLSPEGNSAHPLPCVAIDLFCGCGGMTQGLKDAGFTVLGAVDVDPLAVETYRANHPGVAGLREADITEIDVCQFRESLGLSQGDLDLLAGCPPCQGFSRMRTLNGGKLIQDERNDLVYQFYRFVREFRPHVVMMENVPGLRNDSRVKLLRRRLQKLGYSVTIEIRDAADFGVPQRRRRMILLAGLHGSVPYALPHQERTSVEDFIRSLKPAGSSGDPIHDLPEKRSARVRTLIDSIPRNGGSRSDLSESLRLPCHERCNGFKDVYGRMEWKGVAPTITSGCTNPSKGRFLHPEENRAITLREASLLQTFPPEYYFSLKRGKQGASVLIGNALPVEFVKSHALAVLQYIEMHRGHG